MFHSLLGRVGSIPSPSFNTIDIGPLSLTMYGLMIGLGIIAAAMISRPRALARGMHPDIPIEMLMWVVPAGIVGARLYHIITDAKPIGEWLQIWNGGLGIPGGIAAGAVAGLAFARRHDLTRNKLIDAVIPGVPLAQAIGRLGNWWNQELYGGPTDLPWGLEIDAEHRLSGYSDFETFHPTFLYEMIWNLGLVGFLIWIDRRQILKPGKLIWVYAGGYAIGRLWIETVRIDPANTIAGLRVNLWVMTAILAVSAWFLRDGLRSADASGDETAEDTDGAVSEDPVGDDAIAHGDSDDGDEDRNEARDEEE